MMLILRDDPVIEVFDAPDNPPNRIEPIDVENEAYSFRDDHGQPYVGVVTQPIGWFFRRVSFELRPVGAPDIANAIALVERAVAIEPNDKFADLASLRNYLVKRQKV
jgi:hypothetical protein